ncbi:ubiquitin-conjugating enzyme/RWD-like protein [Circinella umbellata]|nr:ubiquitin-conjugating enzyme/RWD-like protein [Circinella umbellata]
MKIPYEYPKMPTEFKFLTKIYHPNVDKNGRSCAFDTWIDNWGESVALSTVLKSLRMILMQPDAMEILINNDSYETKAREYTRKFASEERVIQQVE